MTVTALYDVCAEVLDAAEQILATTTAGTPGSSFVAAGQMAVDCETLTVHCASLGEAGKAGDPSLRSRTMRVNRAVLSVRVVRCVPVATDTGSALSDSALQAVAAAVLEDGWALWNGLMLLKRQGSLLDGLCSEIEFESLNPIPVEGGQGGWDLRLSVQVNGYAPSLSS